MKRNLMVMLLSASLSMATAQQINYRAESFNDKLSPFKMSLVVAGYRYVFTPTVGGMAEGVVGNRLGYHALYLQAPISLFRPDQVLNDPVDKRKLDHYFEAGADLILASWSKPGSGTIKIITGSDGSYTHFFNARVDIRKTFGIRGGAMQYNYESLYMRQDLNPNLATTDIKAFRNYTMIGGYAGLCFRKFKKARITTDGTIYYRNYQRIFYMDVMTAGGSAPAIHLNGVSYKPNTQVDNLGYRMGFKWDQMGSTTIWEFGKQPGPMSPQEPSYHKYFNYMTLGFAFNLFGGDKRYGMR
ncbi:MAG: hypothetical protein GC180_01400 [Bacteroidetes bacterium]|nr:hypothetical protein [Bacteroidota bacterium]